MYYMKIALKLSSDRDIIQEFRTLRDISNVTNIGT